VAKTHRMPYDYRSFSAKKPFNCWLFFHVTLKNESCHTHEPLRVTRMNCCTCEWVISHVWIIACVNESYHTYELLYAWMSHITRKNCSVCLKKEIMEKFKKKKVQRKVKVRKENIRSSSKIIRRACTGMETSIGATIIFHGVPNSMQFCGTWLIHTWDVTHSYVGRDSLICGRDSFVLVSVLPSFSMACQIACSSATWLIHMRDVTHSYVGRDSLLCGWRLVSVLLWGGYC